MMKSSECFYCGAVTAVYEKDHFPVPRRHGGDSLVVACVACHDMKDRVGLYNWPIEAVSAAVQTRIPLNASISDLIGLMGSLPKSSCRFQRIFVAKMISVMMDSGLANAQRLIEVAYE